MTLQTDFIKSTHQINKHNPNDQTKLKLYGFYKQATIGVCNTQCPGVFGGIRERYKWDAWDECKKMSKDDAMQEYIKLVNDHASGK